MKSLNIDQNLKVYFYDSVNLISRFLVLNSLKTQMKLNSDVISNKKLVIVIRNSVVLRKSFLKNVSNVLEEFDPKVIYFNYYSLSKFRILKRNHLPAWSKFRFEQLDYLGPIVVIQGLEFFLNNQTFEEILKSHILEYPVQQSLNFAYVDLSINKSQRINKAKNKLSIKISNKNLAPNLISVVIPTRGTLDPKSKKYLISNLIASINKQNLDGKSLEVIVVYDSDANFSYLNDLTNQENIFTLKTVPYDPPFNFSKKSNLGAENATGDVILFLNDDTEFITSDAIVELAGTAMIQNVGAVGAKLFFADKSIQHGGIVVINGNVGHAYFKENCPEIHFGDLQIIHEVSGVTGACFAQRKKIWQSMGGWDENFANSYNDVEYCFRLRDAGYSILQNNYVELFHFESLTRDPSFSPQAKALLELKWKKYLADEVFFPQYVADQLRKNSFRKFVKKLIRKFRVIS